MGAPIQFILSSSGIEPSLMYKLGLTFSVGNTNVLFECLLDRLRECYGDNHCYRYGSLYVEPGDYTLVKTDDSIHNILRESSKYESGISGNIEILTYTKDRHAVTLVHLPSDTLFHPSSYSDLLSVVKTSIDKMELDVYKVVFIVSNSESALSEVEMLEVFKM